MSSAVAPAPTVSPLAGIPAPGALLVDPARMERDYYERSPDLDAPEKWVDTENLYKLCAESFQSETHLAAIVPDAREIVHHALTS